MSDLIETLASYVPELIARRLAVDPNPITGPVSERFPAAVFFADISGFTTLTERLARHGPAGAEELTRLLNAYFGQLIDLLRFHGGDIVKFAGDALVALWPVGTTDEDLATVTHRAAQCGLLVQSMLHDQEVAEGVRLSLRVSVGAGEILTKHVGGVHGRWEFLVSGLPLTQVGSASHFARPGEVVLSPEAWTLVSSRCLGTPLPAVNGQPGSVILEDVRETLPYYTAPPLHLNHEMETALRAYIPGAILARLAAGQGGWLAELRRVSIIFINLPDLTYAMPLEQAQTVMRTLQAELYHYEGSINKLSVDDKGVSLVAALGLPPLAHEDDAARAVQAAQAMQAALRQMGLRSAVGVTSGRAFCGTVGSALRREYTMLGDVVNMAARLMQAAPDDILCDAATFQAGQVQADLAFDALPAISVKGKTGPISVYRPLADAAPRQPKAIATRASRFKQEMIGRTAERAILAEELQALLHGDSGGVVIIEAEAGLGKSRLVEDVLQKAQALGITSLVGAGDAIEKLTPYHTWRPVFRQLFNLDGSSPDAETRRANVLRQLACNFGPEQAIIAASPDLGEAGEPIDLLRLAPLLNAVLPLDLPENELTVQMTGKVRADNTREFLVRLLQTIAHRGANQPDQPWVLILEDAHWLDSASWALALLMNQRIQPFQPALMVVATRPPVEHVAEEYNQLLQSPRVRRIVLDYLTVEESLALVCQRLGVTDLPEPVADLIRTRAEGHPFFSEELAYALRDAGLIIIDEGQCRLAPEAGQLETLNFPDTVQGVITSRIDRLLPPQQLALKVASVLGRIFSFSALRDIHPLEADRANLLAYLEDLVRLDITPLETVEPDLSYIFKHIITQEVAYNMMLFAQRQRLHRTAAEWYERTYTADLAPFYSLLAHHWERAGVTDKALDYLEKAGQQALLNYTNQEAVRFFNRALQLGPEQPEGRRAAWELNLGEAYVNWRKLSDGREHLERGLALLRLGVPGTTAGQVRGLLGQVLEQAQYRLKQGSWANNSRAGAEEGCLSCEVLLAAARAYEGLAEVYYFANDTIRSLFSAFRALNLAEQAGLSPELARSYALVGAIMGFVPLPRLADFYCRQALLVAGQVDNLPARAFVALATGTYYTGVGRWNEAADLLNQVVEISESLGDRRRWEDGISNLAILSYFQGHFGHSARLSDSYYESACRRDDLHNQAWALRGKVFYLLAAAHFDEALACLDKLQALLDRDPSLVDEALRIDLLGLLALVYLRRGETGAALELARQALAMMAASSPTSYPSLPAYAGVAEVFLTLWAQECTTGQPGPARSSLRLQARRACRALRGYARVFPIGRPRAALWQGVFEALAGRLYLARHLWRQSLAEAERLAMPYAEGLACYELGRHLPESNPARSAYLERACRIFDHLEASYDLDRASQALAVTQPE